MPYIHLTAEEREVIYRMHQNGDGPTAIGRELGRSPGTISRELQRNSTPLRAEHIVRRCYSAVRAQRMAEARRHAKRSKKLDDPTVQKVVRERLDERWSPEQIAGRMQLDDPDNRRKRVCHQTIYSWIHQQKRLLPSFPKNLRRRGKRYRYGRANVRQMFPERRQIEDRPEIVAARSRLGMFAIHVDGTDTFRRVINDAALPLTQKPTDLNGAASSACSRRIFEMH